MDATSVAFLKINPLLSCNLSFGSQISQTGKFIVIHVDDHWPK